MSKPLLKYVACHRGVEAHALKQQRTFHHMSRIGRGPLVGCWRYIHQNARGQVNTLLFSHSFVLEFRPVIRIEP
jgi:hypothetical protein